MNATVPHPRFVIPPEPECPACGATMRCPAVFDHGHEFLWRCPDCRYEFRERR